MPDDEIRFCHIDVDVYLSAQGIVDWVWPRMVRGGIMVFDGYGSYSCDGITKYVGSPVQVIEPGHAFA